MKKPVLIPFFLIFFSLFSSSACPAEDMVLDPLVVTATRSPLSKSKTAANITVLTRDDLTRLPAHDVGEALSFTPGIFIDRIGGPGSQATVSIYGSEARHVEVYIDGIPQNNLANPLTNLSDIPLSRVSRVEIYKGAASSAWGSALGGVINIITRSPEETPGLHGGVSASYGEFQTWSGSAELSGRKNNHAFLVNGTRLHSDGFSKNRNYDEDSVYGKYIYDLNDLNRLTLAVSNENTKKIDPNLIALNRFETGKGDRSYIAMTMDSSPLESVDISLNLYRQKSFMSHIFSFTNGLDVKSFDYTEEKNGVSLKAGWSDQDMFGLHHNLTAGWDGRWDEYNFSPLGRDVTDVNNGLWISEIIDQGSWSLNLGARWEENENFGSQTSPSAGIVYRFPGLPLLLRAQWAKGFSAPPLTYLFDPAFGNPDLGPETGSTWQAGAEWAPNKTISLSSNLFLADIEDMIYYDASQGKFVNLDEVRRTAAEITVQIKPAASVMIQGSGTWVNVRNTRTDTDVSDIPTRIFDISAQHDWQGIIQTLNGRWVDYNSSWPDTRDERWIFSYKVRKAFDSGLAIWAAMHNITNEKEYHYSFLPSPGRWAEAGFSWSF